MLKEDNFLLRLKNQNWGHLIFSSGDSHVGHVLMKLKTILSAQHNNPIDTRFSSAREPVLGFVILPKWNLGEICS